MADKVYAIPNVQTPSTPVLINPEKCDLLRKKFIGGKNMKKILLTVVAAMLLVVMSVAGTLAYLTATSREVKNTFTVVQNLSLLGLRYVFMPRVQLNT